MKTNTGLYSIGAYIFTPVSSRFASATGRDLDDLLNRCITAVAQVELAHLCSAMSLHPADTRFPAYEHLCEWGFQSIAVFFLHFPIVLRMYAPHFAIDHSIVATAPHVSGTRPFFMSASGFSRPQN